jgi:hypothetical protein
MPSQHPDEIGYGHVVKSYVTRTYGGLPRYLVLNGGRFIAWQADDAAQGMVAIGVVFPHGRVIVFNAFKEHALLSVSPLE